MTAARAGRWRGGSVAIGVSIAGAAVGVLPWGWLPALAWVPTLLAFDLLRIRRREVRAGLAQIGVNSCSIARATYHRLATSALEFLWISAHPERPLADIVRVEGWGAFESQRALGRGVIVATAHTGNWDLAACACAARTRLAVLTKRLSSPRLDRFWQTTRARRGVELIAAVDGDAIARATAVLRAGGAVAVLIDQDPRRARSIVEGEFLGRIAQHDPLVAVLAARTGAGIVTAFARRDAEGRHVVVVETVEAAAGDAREGRVGVADLTMRLSQRLDRFVRETPSEWLWLHRRWEGARIARNPVARRRAGR